MARSNAVGKREGAVQSRTGLRDRYKAWLRHHRLSAADSLTRLLDRPWASLLTWLVIAIAMALPVGMNVALENARSVSDDWDRPAQISLFLKAGMADADYQRFELKVASSEDVEKTRLISSDEALQEFGQISGFGELLDSLDKNPLPNVIVVSPATGVEGEDMARLQTRFQAMEEVDQAVLDMAWVQRLSGIMDLGRRMVLALGALLILGVVLILGNTIRLAIENRRDEIVIIKLVGGSNAFVRRPFLYTGLWYGVGGGAIAALLVSAFLWFIGVPAHSLAQLYQSGFEIKGLGVMGGLNLIVLGGFLGLLGAWLAVSRHLNEIEPR
ncbi:MAG: permease-like cell division protein FtsX [Halioglobus sp.]